MKNLCKIFICLVTATGGCATGDEPSKGPSAADKAHGLVDRMLAGSEIPSQLVDPSATYVRSRSIGDLDRLTDLTPAEQDFARELDGIIDGRANGILEAAELVEAERVMDTAIDRAKIAAYWDLFIAAEDV